PVLSGPWNDLWNSSVLACRHAPEPLCLWFHRHGALRRTKPVLEASGPVRCPRRRRAAAGGRYRAYSGEAVRRIAREIPAVAVDGQEPAGVDWFDGATVSVV